MSNILADELENMKITTQNLNEILKEKKLPIIWVLGGPGSGKGTQCARLVERYGFVHLSSGDLLRDEVASGSPKGKELNDIMEKGLLVPREVVLDLIKAAIEKNVQTAKGFLIDGYPREVEQGIDFENKIAPSTLILYFDCADETMTKRLIGRGQSSGRVDDNLETIKKRLDTFHLHSKPVMAHYASKVATISADTDPDSIFAASRASVDKALKEAGIPVPP